MGFRDGIRKPGGGILHNRIGMVRDYRFTTDTPWDQKSRGKGKELLYLELSIREDGSDQDTVQPLFIGSEEFLVVSDDEKDLTDAERDTISVNAETGAGKFLLSMLDAEFPENRLPDLKGGDPLNLQGIIGTRFRFEQRVNEALTKEKGKKDGKWNYTDLVVSEVVSLPDAKAGKSNGAAKGAKPTTAAGAGEDTADIATEAVVAVVGAADKQTLNIKRLKMAVLGNIGMKHPRRQAVVDYVADPANIAAMDGIAFNEKSGMVSLA